MRGLEEMEYCVLIDFIKLALLQKGQGKTTVSEDRYLKLEVNRDPTASCSQLM